MNKYKLYISGFAIILGSLFNGQKLATITPSTVVKTDSLNVVEEKPLSVKELVDLGVENIKNDPVLRNAHWGFVVYDPQNGKVINAYNENESFTPASTTKLLTTETALNLLGKNFVWHTQLEYSGVIDENGILHGNLYIVGSGDPTLGTGKAGAYRYGEIATDFVNAIMEKGIKKVNGNIYIQNGFFKKNKVGFLPKNIVWMDHKDYYLPVGSTKDIDPKKERFLKYINRVSAVTQKYFYVSPYSNKLVFSEEYQPVDFTTKISTPPYYLASTVKKYLLKRQIPVTGIVEARTGELKPEPRNLITYYKSPTLEEIVFYTNKRSDNALAEALLKSSGFYAKGDQTKSTGREAVVEHLTEDGFYLDGFNYYDGSGLSRQNKVSPIAHAKFLSNLMKQEYFPQMFKSLPVGGQSGTLRRMFKGAGNGKVFAKTGTLRGVKTLAGYIKTDSGKTLVFSLLINGYRGSVSQVKQKMEQILEPVIKM